MLTFSFFKHYSRTIGLVTSVILQWDEYVVVDTSTHAGFLSKKSVAICVSITQIIPLMNRSCAISMLIIDK
jgi:hypothetical protein